MTRGYGFPGITVSQVYDFRDYIILSVYSYLLLDVLAPSPKGVECPFLGRYEISGGLNAEDVGKALAASRPGSENNQDKPTPCDPPGKQYLTVGCNSPDTMEFQSECGTKTVAGKPTAYTPGYRD